MDAGLLGLLLFALWWVMWALVWAVGVLPRRRSGALPVLLAYELTLVPLVLGVLVLALASPGDLPSAASSWPWWSIPLVAVPAGALAWVALTAGQGLNELRPGGVTRRLLIGAASDSWSAAGEEVAFRLLLLGGLALWWDSAWVAWLVTSVLFGLHHLPVGGRRVALAHTGSGAVFGLLFVLGGGLAAAVLAHVAYNVLTATARETGMRRAARSVHRFGLRR